LDPDLLEFIKKKFKEYFGPIGYRVILFGSRARNDHEKTSDYDLAIDLDPKFFKEDSWVRFTTDLADNAPTLSSIDLIHLNHCPKPLIDRIQKEGTVVHESKDQR
jgi:predicted nucleotidyltransferase